MNLNINLMSFMEPYLKNDRIREIMQTSIKYGMQPHEIEKLINELTNEEIELYKKFFPNNPISIMLKAGTGIKKKQFGEMTVAGGLKPALDGSTIPVPISHSYLIGGTAQPSEHYVDSIASRKSLIMNKKEMGRAGYFGKIVLRLTRTVKLSNKVWNCDTKHLLTIDVHDEDILKKYNDRYYVTDLESRNFKILNAKNDKHLIGKKVHFRSPITCTCGDEVCSVCFGRTSLYNMDIADGIAGFATEEITKEIEQKILSSKHLLTTVSKMIKFNEEFYRFFSLDAGEITPILSNEEVDLENWVIFIDPNEIQRSDDMDSDSSFNTFINRGFYVMNLETGESIEMVTEDDRELYFREETLELIKKSKNGYISFKDLDEETTLFEILILNNELTKPLYDIMALINRSNKDMTYTKMAQTFTELLIKSDIAAMALGAELIINRLVRNDPDIDFERPDFSQERLPKYQIYTIFKALEYNNSSLVGLSSQNIKRQLLSYDLFDKKKGTSYIDDFFEEKIPTGRLLEIQDILRRYPESEVA